MVSAGAKISAYSGIEVFHFLSIRCSIEVTKCTSFQFPEILDILGLIKRCYQCRSRGELGSCKDPFRYNASHVDTEPGVTTVPCASGWCGKVIEGDTGAFREDGELKRVSVCSHGLKGLLFRLRHGNATNVRAERA